MEWICFSGNIILVIPHFTAVYKKIGTPSLEKKNFTYDSAEIPKLNNEVPETLIYFSYPWYQVAAGYWWRYPNQHSG